MTRLSKALIPLLVACATSMACGSPISGTPNASCLVEPESTCLCDDGTYQALICAQDGSIYCDCATQTSPLVTLDAAPDLDVSSDTGSPADDMTLEDMAPDMPGDAAPDMNTCPPGGCAPVNCELVLGNDTLPPGWSTSTVGYLGDDLPPQHGWLDGQLCLRAAGDDIWSREDRFYYVSQPGDGDFDLSARVDVLEGVEDNSKISLMFRASDDASAPFVMLQFRANSSADMMARDDVGEEAAIALTHRLPAGPYWLRMIRREDTFYSYTSPDGATWKPLGAMQADGMPKTGRIGFTLSSHEPTAYANVSLSRITLEQGNGRDGSCPADIACEEVDTYRGIDLARKGGLDPNKFLGADAETYVVTDPSGDMPGSLLHAIQQAEVRADSGLYTLIEVDTSQVREPIVLTSPARLSLSHTWLRGNGVTIKADSSALSLFRLDQQVIVEGVRFERSAHALIMSLSGGIDKTERTGIWIHHNSFEQCERGCIKLGPSADGETRYITVSHNVFGIDGVDGVDDIDAINASNQCADPNDVACLELEQNLWLSAHHNIFGAQVLSGYPRGGAHILSYNNHIRSLTAPGIDLSSTGQILSRQNIFTGSNDPVQVFTGGTGVNSVSDYFEQGATPIISYDSVALSAELDFFTYFHFPQSFLGSALQQEAGPPPAP